MDICKCKVSAFAAWGYSKYPSSLSSSRWVGGKGREVGVLPQNWGGNEPNRCRLYGAQKLRITIGVQLSPLHGEFRGSRSGLRRSCGFSNHNKNGEWIEDSILRSLSLNYDIVAVVSLACWRRNGFIKGNVNAVLVGKEACVSAGVGQPWFFVYMVLGCSVLFQTWNTEGARVLHFPRHQYHNHKMTELN
ncbi:hypothetical protein TNCV_1874521 [Trichonephila clavipes]|nr:hypothetical protein TNCV_1874521 [Trichonephila clavipes]